jgi:signal transduction histidine kinase
VSYRVGGRLHECLRGFPAAALELSADGLVLDSNGRLEALLRRDIIGHPFAELLDATSRPKWERLLMERDAERGGAVWELVLETESMLELRSFAATWGRIGDEDLLWLIEYTRDLRMEPLYEELSAANSDLVNIQRELAKDQARLARALESEQKARAEAERAIRVRDGVLQVVAHDLRNPLGRIGTTVSLLREEESLSAADRERLLGVLQRTTTGMMRLVQDLVDAASIEAGRLSVYREPLDVNQLIGDICTAYATTAGERGLRIDCERGHDVPPVSADRGRIAQVVNNLLDNAIRLTPRGGRIVLRTEAEEGGARLSVSDTGPGIDAEDIPHLFDRFWQGQRSRRGSSGLGLAIAKGIVDAHNGRIWVESTPGHGSTFFILLPTLTHTH